MKERNIKHSAVQRVCLVICICLLCLGVSGCCTQHEWEDATCTTPKTCSKCRATDGEPLGHTPGEVEIYEHDDGYTKMTHCTVCGKVASKDTVTPRSEGKTVQDYIDAFNDYAAEVNASGKTGDINIDSLHYSGSGDTITINGGIQILFNYVDGGLSSEYDLLESVSLYVDDVTEYSSEFLGCVYSCYVYGMNEDFVNGEYRDKVMDYLLAPGEDVQSSLKMVGYTFKNLNVGTTLFCYIDIN